jgi:hypothetical protein
MTRYVPSRHYLQAGLAALLASAFSAWCGRAWPPAYVAAGLSLLSTAVLLYLARRPVVEVHDTHLAIGSRRIPWTDIRSLDRKYLSPLIVRITLFNDSRILLIYPGEMDSANSLLRHLRRYAREALIDGKPRPQEDVAPGVPEAKPPASQRCRLLRPEDEAEVERLYQRLKSVRHLDPDNSGDEK